MSDDAKMFFGGFMACLLLIFLLSFGASIGYEVAKREIVTKCE